PRPTYLNGYLVSKVLLKPYMWLGHPIIPNFYGGDSGEVVLFDYYDNPDCYYFSTDEDRCFERPFEVWSGELVQNREAIGGSSIELGQQLVVKLGVKPEKTASPKKVAVKSPHQKKAKARMKSKRTSDDGAARNMLPQLLDFATTTSGVEVAQPKAVAQWSPRKTTTDANPKQKAG
ncbi:unnamed protein product, partial [Amoebophrya sp. A25]